MGGPVPHGAAVGQDRSRGILRQWLDAAYLQMEYSDQKYGALTPWTILDADGAVLDDDRDMWDELDNGANVPTLISNLSDDGGDWSEQQDVPQRP